MMRHDQIRLSAAFVFFNVAFFPLWVFGGLLHLHGWRSLLLAGIGATLFVIATRRQQRSLMQSYQRPKNARLPPPTGNRRERRAESQRQQQRQKHREK